MKRSVNFLKSAVQPKDFLFDNIPEVALVGRSNAGKSSLLNAFSKESGVAHVSRKPGKTQLINFFQVGDHYRMVDLPGYGYAKVSENLRKEWRKMVDTYFEVRPQLVGAVFIKDIRRDWDRLDDDVLEYLKSFKLKIVIAASKADLLKVHDRKKIIQEWESTKTEFDVQYFSSQTGQGIEDLEKHVFAKWIKPLLTLSVKSLAGQ